VYFIQIIGADKRYKLIMGAGYLRVQVMDQAQGEFCPGNGIGRTYKIFGVLIAGAIADVVAEFLVALIEPLDLPQFPFPETFNSTRSPAGINKRV
jgi:hypothetical protein